MISGETLTVSLEEAIENHLLRSGNPAATSGGEDEDYWTTVEKHVAAEDYTPLLGLVAELRDKIIGLTPRRRDLAAETSEAMDVELLEQMMDYSAFDVVRACVHTIRVFSCSLLCALSCALYSVFFVALLQEFNSRVWVRVVCCKSVCPCIFRLGLVTVNYYTAVPTAFFVLFGLRVRRMISCVMV